MAWSKREQKVWNEIKEWEHQLLEYEPTDFEMTYDKWIERSFEKIDPNIRERFFNNLDNWLFHLNALLQGSQTQIDSRHRILTEARVFNDNITELSDLKSLSIDQLIFLADQQTAKHRLLSFVQGGLSGTGSILMISSDLPAQAIINLRAIQLTAMTYGYDVSTPFEMMLSLKVFHTATLPKRLQAQAWNELIEELKNTDNHYYFYEGDENITNETWLDLPLKQFLKALFIMTFRKKLVQGLPLIGMAIGAGMNFKLTRQVTEAAQRFYQYRFLLEKDDQFDDGLF